MSGGHFNYAQYRIREIVDEVEVLIANNDSTEKDEWGNMKGSCYSPETIVKFKEALGTLQKAEIMAQRIDWLVSGDDGEESFHQCWQGDLNRLNVK